MEIVDTTGRLDRCVYLTDAQHIDIFAQMRANNSTIFIGTEILQKKYIKEITKMSEKESELQNKKPPVRVLLANNDTLLQKVENAKKEVMAIMMHEDADTRHQLLIECAEKHGKFNTKMQCVYYLFSIQSEITEFSDFFAKFFKKQKINKTGDIFALISSVDFSSF